LPFDDLIDVFAKSGQVQPSPLSTPLVLWAGKEPSGKQGKPRHYGEAIPCFS